MDVAAVTPRAEQESDVSSVEARIDQLYDEIRDLVARSAENPDLEADIERKREKLRALQTEEAAAILPPESSLPSTGTQSPQRHPTPGACGRGQTPRHSARVLP